MAYIMFYSKLPEGYSVSFMTYVIKIEYNIFILYNIHVTKFTRIQHETYLIHTHIEFYTIHLHNTVSIEC